MIEKEGKREKAIERESERQREREGRHTQRETLNFHQRDRPERRQTHAERQMNFHQRDRETERQKKTRTHTERNVTVEFSSEGQRSTACAGFALVTWKAYCLAWRRSCGRRHRPLGCRPGRGGADSTRSEAGTRGGVSAGVYYPSSSSCEVPQKQKGERLREKRKRKCVGYCVSLFCALL